MNNGMAQVLESVFGRRELDAVSVEEIRELIAEFPSFNAGHYFLSRKLKNGDAVAYASATRQTALYFNNPLWLELLLEDDVSEPVPDTISVNESFHAVQEEIPTVNQVMHTAQDESPTINEAVHSVSEEIPTVNEVLETGSVPTLNETLEPVSDEEVAAFDTAEQATERESLLDETFGGVNQEDTVPPDDLPQPDPMFDDNPAFEWPAEATPDLTVKIEPGTHTEPEMPAYPETGMDPEMPVHPETDTTPEMSAQPQAMAQPEQETPGSTELDVLSGRMSAELAAAAQALTATRPAEPGFDEKKAKSIVFEPYHTIDYFASQGIKLVMDDNPKDSFGRQLKTFTDWLKTMKRLPVQPLTGKADETETAEVKHFAADSVEDRDILTETMAEVLVKQGMNDKAIAIYEKLSLINPLKSAYFAARIQQLKVSRT